MNHFKFCVSCPISVISFRNNNTIFVGRLCRFELVERRKIFVLTRWRTRILICFTDELREGRDLVTRQVLQHPETTSAMRSFVVFKGNLFNEVVESQKQNSFLEFDWLFENCPVEFPSNELAIAIFPVGTLTMESQHVHLRNFHVIFPGLFYVWKEP